MSRSGVVERDLGWGRIQRDLRTMARRNPGVRVGVLATATERYEPEDGGAPLTVVEVAFWNEFGTERIPARPAITTTLENNRAAVNTLKERLLAAVLRGTMTVDRALGLLGVDFQAKMRKNITDLREPPNAPMTIEAKGSDNPLVDEGIYRGSISWERD